MDKKALLTLPDEVYNWIRDFFSSHSHCTKFAGEVSSLVDITASVIQVPVSVLNNTLSMPLTCVHGMLRII